MVDFRPLMFVNALALMLLVTAGFASVQQGPILESSGKASVAMEQHGLDTLPPPAAAPQKPAEKDHTATPKPEKPREHVSVEQPSPLAPSPEPALTAEVFEVEPLPDGLETVAIAQPSKSLTNPEFVSPAKKPEPATTGKLVLRSNVVGDQVTINGKNYGATRLDLELDPGSYEITIQKPGHKPWENTIALKAGQELTLVGQLEQYTTVNYSNGRWVGGVKTGDGSWIDETGLRYEGHFVNGLFDGTGTAWYPDGSRYEGDWEKGQQHGEGQWRGADNAQYTGRFERNEFHGQGTLTKANGDILTGNWVQGKMQGPGSLTTADGHLYVGSFRNGEFHGEGRLTYPDGRSYEGQFSNGSFHGQGSEIFADGKKYDGQYMDGKFHGAGLLRNPNGSSIEATFRLGEPYGKVRLTTAAGEVFTARTTEPGVCYRDKSYRATQCPQLEGW
ncbi:MORN repeat protein [Marinobacter litoralis]|uniref:MORN repeat protein n=1 Tax=Marinobacter litoralis TaxID=187981 RepID=A0A3M2RKR7_9GAMM|nr:PEGA domain-containing protein [Marinobacter litoralis]RMJ05943.1 MORN repeat protein [Marinobacter litoralis]